MNYTDSTDSVYAMYSGRMLVVLESLRDTLPGDTYRVDIYDASSDEYMVAMNIFKGDNLVAGVDIILLESLLYEGTEDGWNFQFNIYDGHGNCEWDVSLYNFTPNVWVKSVAALGVRWDELIERIPWKEFPKLVAQLTTK